MPRRVPSHLLSDFTAWKATGPSDDKEFGLLGYLGCVATPDLLFAFVELLAPELVRHEGSYFIAERFSVEVYEQWQSRLDDPREIERVVNHLHMTTLFQEQDVPDEVAVAAAHTIAELWTRHFESLGLVGVAYGETFDSAEVTLHSRGGSTGL